MNALEEAIKAIFSQYIYSRSYDTGVWAAVAEMTFGKGRIVIGDLVLISGGCERVFCYDSIEVAVAALKAWDGNGEPSGWSRDPMTGRRRPDGDPLREYVMQ